MGNPSITGGFFNCRLLFLFLDGIFFLCKHTMEYSDVRHDFSCGKHDHNMCGKAGKLESSGECNTEISPFLVQSSKVFG